MGSSFSTLAFEGPSMRSLILLLVPLTVLIAVLRNFRWLQRFILSLWQTDWKVAYGIHSNMSELLFCHFGFLFRAIFVHICNKERTRKRLIEEIEAKFLSVLNKRNEQQQQHQVVITHSCRTIFYCIIQSLLNAKDVKHIKICSASVHFGSFYRLLRAIELAQKCTIEHYEIPVNAHDFTLNTDNIDEQQVRECDLILCQHFFGLPFDQTALFELGRKYEIPVLEDCVQTGSLFGKYKGHPLADVLIWSCGLDKTPACFGGGLGYFSHTQHGQALYQKVRAMTDEFRVDTWRDRLVSLLKQMIHLIFTRNHFLSATWVAIIGYFVYYRGKERIKYYELALQVRQNKAITPFQHQSSLFLTQPSVAQLYSIRYGLNKNYDAIIAKELKDRALLLDNIPDKYHTVLFPWMTDKVLKGYRENRGIGEFTWVYSKSGDRAELNDFLCENLVITTINTTWVHHKTSTLKENKAPFMCENMTYLPNMHEMNERQIVKVAKVLAAYCESDKF